MRGLKWFLWIVLGCLLTSCKYIHQFLPTNEKTAGIHAATIEEAAKAAQKAREEAEQAARAALAAQQEAEQAALAIRSLHVAMVAEAEVSKPMPEVEDPTPAPPPRARTVAKTTTRTQAVRPPARQARPALEPVRPKRSPASVPGSTQMLGRQVKETKKQLEARFKKSLRLFESRDEEQYVKLIITEPDGTKKLREIFVQRASAPGEQRMLARVMKPFDLKGASVLLVATKHADDQWVYLPSSKQTRKVVVAEKKGAILGSELRYEDFNPAAIRRSDIDLLKTERIEGKNYDVFELKIPPGASLYERAWVWVDPKSEMPIQIEYYIGQEKVKTIEFFDYYKVGKIWRPGKLSIKNLKTRRGTDIEISNVKINKGLSADRLTVEALSKSW